MFFKTLQNIVISLTERWAYFLPFPWIWGKACDLCYSNVEILPNTNQSNKTSLLAFWAELPCNKSGYPAAIMLKWPQVKKMLQEPYFFHPQLFESSQSRHHLCKEAFWWFQPSALELSMLTPNAAETSHPHWALLIRLQIQEHVVF